MKLEAALPGISFYGLCAVADDDSDDVDDDNDNGAYDIDTIDLCAYLYGLMSVRIQRETKSTEILFLIPHQNENKREREREKQTDTHTHTQTHTHTRTHTHTHTHTHSNRYRHTERDIQRQTHVVREGKYRHLAHCMKSHTVVIHLGAWLEHQATQQVCHHNGLHIGEGW